MSRNDLTEEDAKVIFAKQLKVLAAAGPDPDCARKIAEIIAENEAECPKMEREFEAAEEEDRMQRAAAGG